MMREGERERQRGREKRTGRKRDHEDCCVQGYFPRPRQ